MSRTLFNFAIAVATLMPVAAWAAPAPSYAVVGRIKGADGGWDYASFDADSGRVYVARSNAVMAVDVATRKVIDALAPADGAHEVLAIDGGRTVVETDGHTGNTRFIDAATGQITAEVATGRKPDAAALDPVSGRVVVVSPGNDMVSEIDPASHKLVASFTVPGGLEAAVADGKGHVFFNLEDAGGLVEIDAVAGKLLRIGKLAGCTGPSGIALVAGGTRVISSCDNGIAVVTDAATGALVTTLRIDKGPDSVLVDEQRQLAFIPCGASGTLVIISTADPDHLRVVGKVKTQVGARTGAINPRDGRIYLPTAKFAPPAPGARHGKPLPGSFVILVLAPKA